MEPISNVDRLVILLRQRLAERANVAPGRGKTAQAVARTTPASALSALAAIEGIEERHLRRALIQNLLSESLGEKVVNEASFHQVVDRVVQTIEADAQASGLLHRMVRELKADR